MLFLDNIEADEDPKVSQAKYFICDQFLVSLFDLFFIEFS
jgi:hypothetical protein